MATSKLPDAARVLPPKGQALWLKAFNESKDEGNSDEEASIFAWSAVKRAGYRKISNGKWGKSMDATLTMEENGEFVLGIPFVKVNSTNRTVSGFATLDNVDNAGDLLDASASKEAFAKWIGNIREMHEKKAVGKAISIEEKPYVAPDGNTYNGMWITAKISKGAEDTWQKVLDGTLAGFSVGGATLEKEADMVKVGDTERRIWRIKKYRLNEVSLVDAPCNGYATVSLVKSIDGHLEVDDVVATGEVDEELSNEDLEKAYSFDGQFVDMSKDVAKVIKSLEDWRSRALSINNDHLVSSISKVLADFRYTFKDEESQAKYQAVAKAAEKARKEALSKDNDDLEGSNAQEQIIKEDTELSTQENLQDNVNSDTSNTDELAAEHKSALRKLAEFILGAEASTETDKTEEDQELTKEGDVTPEMDKTQVEELVNGAAEELNKSVDEKFVEVGASLTKITELLEGVAKSESVDELKKEIDEKISEISERVEALETTGAVKKSGDTDSGETLEKSNDQEGLWADSLVPSFLRKQIEV